MKYIQRFFMWLLPGMKVKRWIFLSWIGLTLFSIGIILYIKITPFITMEIFIVDLVKKASGLQIKTQYVDIFFIIFGMFILIVGIRQWFVSIYREVAPNKGKNLVEVIYEKRQLGHGIKIVTIGGGTGLSTLLRGLKTFTTNIAAVVTVADDGGSSGRLRREMGVLPPGDIRNCLVALADEENLMGELFQYRFTEGDSLEGHSFGNLFLVALTNIAGDFDKAIKQTSNILAIKGRVLPATLCPVTLCAIMNDGKIVEGESSITKDERKIETVFLEPSTCKPPKEVLETIQNANIIILGPGSLYTSVIPNLLIDGIVNTINSSQAIVIYVCNVMTQPGETDNFKASDHLKTILKHASGLRIDYCLINKEIPPLEILKKYEEQNQFFVEADWDEIEKIGVTPIPSSFISAKDLVRHNPEKLAESIIKLNEKGVS